MDRGSLEGSRLLPTYSNSNNMVNTYLGQARTKIKHKKQSNLKITSRHGDRKYITIKEPKIPDKGLELLQNTGMLVNSYKVCNKTERTNIK